jgi:hypothetical protein
VKRRVPLLTVLATLALIGATNVPAGAGPGVGADARNEMMDRALDYLT